MPVKDAKSFKKKTSFYKERDKVKRTEFQKEIENIPIENRVYVDESGVDYYLYRLFARSISGKAVFGAISGKRYKRECFVAAKVEGKVIAPFCYQGTCDTHLFNWWIEKFLIPELKPGQVVIMNNATFHKSQKTKDLMLSPDIEAENEYQELLNNLVACLSPYNQLESLLVEKIAVDFWRLRRTIRFETGSISQSIKSLFKEIYSYENQSNEKIDEEICEKQQLIVWNLSYIECLTTGEVTFDQPEWQGKGLSSDIIEDFYLIAKSIPTLTDIERKKNYCSADFTFEELRVLLKKYGYLEAKQIVAKLIELYTKAKSAS